MKDLLNIQFIPEDIQKCSSYAECIDSLPLAYAYVPYQRYEAPYSKEKALPVGSIFPSLNKPFGVYGKEFNAKDGAVK